MSRSLRRCRSDFRVLARYAAVVFTCISDSRQTARAIAVPVSFALIDTGDDVLRAWLRDAPRMGLLT